jgi:hypothetical protein
MPGCVLRVSGDQFHPGDYLAGSALAPCNVFVKGERRGRDSFWDSSGFTVVVSDASANDLRRQIFDAVEFLRVHRKELVGLATCVGVEDVRLDFGIARKNGFLQSSELPVELITIAGELRIGIEISIYGEDES